MERKSKGRKRVPGLQLNLTEGAATFIVPASTEPTIVKVRKVPRKTNKLAVEASKPVEFEK